MKNKWLLISAFIVFCSFQIKAHYVIRLKSGGEIIGRVLHYTDGMITIQTESGQKITGPIDNIQSIIFSDHEPVVLPNPTTDQDQATFTEDPENKSSQEEMLEGRDLIAWKLARQTAANRCREYSQPPPTPVPSGHGTRAQHAAIVASQRAAQQPRFKLEEPSPKISTMEKNQTGDWIFRFPVKASYYNVEEKKHMPRRETMIVEVTDYGTEMRVERCILERSQ